MSNAKFSVFYAHICDLAREKNIDLKEAAAFVKDLGFEAVDCDYRYIKDHFETFTAFLKECSFAVSAVPCYFFFDKGIDEAFIDDALLITDKVNCKTMLAIPGEYIDSDSEKDREIKLSRMVEGLKLLCKKAEKYGINITLEDYDDIHSPCATDDGLAYFFEKVPALGFTMDTGNFMYSDLDTSKCIKRFGDRIKHAHLKDRAIIKRHEDQPVKLTVHDNALYPSSVGSGVIPMKELTDFAKENGYEGYYTAENSCPIHMEEFLTESIKWMKENI